MASSMTMTCRCGAERIPTARWFHGRVRWAGWVCPSCSGEVGATTGAVFTSARTVKLRAFPAEVR